MLVGEVYFSETTIIQCKDCNDLLVDAKNCRLIDTLLGEREASAIGKLPINKFISSPEAAKILGYTRQALYKNRGIATGKIIRIKRGNHTEYYKLSV